MKREIISLYDKCLEYKTKEDHHSLKLGSIELLVLLSEFKEKGYKANDVVKNSFRNMET